MTGNNPKLDPVNVDVHTKFDQNLSLHSQDMEWKPNIHGITEGQGESSIAPLFQSGAIIIGFDGLNLGYFSIYKALKFHPRLSRA